MRVLAAAGLATAAIGLGACGSDDESDSRVTTSAPRKVDGPAFKVGFLCSCSGAQAAALAAMGDVYEAWAKSVNDKGGIDGHPVKVVVKDDAGNPANALRNAKELVTNDGVQALVDASLADAAFEKYVSSSGVPVIGGISSSTPFITSASFFPVGTQLPVETLGTMQLAKDNGKAKVGVMYCAETPLCAQLIPLAQGTAKLAGLDGIAKTSVSATAPNYTAPCQKLKGDGVDALFVAHNSEVVQRITASCAQQGYKPLTVNQTNTLSTKWLDDPNMDGSVLASSLANYQDTSNPGVKAFSDAIDRYLPDLKSGDQFSYDTFYSWASGKLFEAVVKAGRLTPTSKPADVMAAAQKIKNDDLGGIAPPLTFAKGRPSFVACYFGAKLDDGKLTSLNDGKPTCLTTAQAKGLQSALGG